MKRITRVLVVSALAAATLSACTDNGGHDMDNMNSTRTSPGAASCRRTTSYVVGGTA